MAVFNTWPGDSPAAWIDDIGHAIAERYRRIEDSLRATLERPIEQHLDVPDDTLARYRAVQSLREQAEHLAKQVDPNTLEHWAPGRPHQRRHRRGRRRVRRTRQPPRRVEHRDRCRA